MLESIAVEKENSVISLRDYIAEQAPEKPYKLIAFYNTGETRRDIKEPNTMQILNLLDIAIETVTWLQIPFIAHMSEIDEVMAL